MGKKPDSLQLFERGKEIGVNAIEAQAIGQSIIPAPGYNLSNFLRDTPDVSDTYESKFFLFSDIEVFKVAHYVGGYLFGQNYKIAVAGIQGRQQRKFFS